MGNNWPTKRRIALAYAALLLGAFGLLFCRLDGRPLWGDEAETANLAKNILRYGIPKTFDGVNRITLLGAAIDGNAQDVWIWSPWLQEYVAAGSFLVFGANTWASRAPFAFIGWLTIIFLGWVAYRVYGDHRVALGSIALLATSEIFLLHARQCRYYTLTTFAELLFIYGIYESLAGNQRSTWLLAASLTLQFYSNYIIAFANLPVLLALGFTLHEQNRGGLLRLGAAIGLFLLLIAPWLFYAPSSSQSQYIFEGGMVPRALTLLREFHFHFMPLALFILPLFGLAARLCLSKPGATRLMVPAKAKSIPALLSRFELQLLLLLPLYLVVISMPTAAFLRYMLPVIPVVCLLSAVWLFRYLKWPSLACGLLLLQCVTNALAMATAYPLRGEHHARLPLYEFVQGLACSYKNRFGDLLQWLHQHTQTGQTVLVMDPEFPIIFYTPLRIIDARLLGGQWPNALPDWVLSQSPSGTLPQNILVLPEELQSNYETIALSVHNSALGETNPNPDRFKYLTETNLSAFVIYRKKQPMRKLPTIDP